MSDVDPASIKQALRAALTSPRGKVSRTATGRRELEKAANNPRKSERGKTVQLNVEIREDRTGARQRCTRVSQENLGDRGKPASRAGTEGQPHSRHIARLHRRAEIETGGVDDRGQSPQSPLGERRARDDDDRTATQVGRRPHRRAGVQWQSTRSSTNRVNAG